MLPPTAEQNWGGGVPPPPAEQNCRGGGNPLPPQQNIFDLGGEVPPSPSPPWRARAPRQRTLLISSFRAGPKARAKASEGWPGFKGLGSYSLCFILWLDQASEYFPWDCLAPFWHHIGQQVRQDLNCTPRSWQRPWPRLWPRPWPRRSFDCLTDIPNELQ